MVCIHFADLPYLGRGRVAALLVLLHVFLMASCQMASCQPPQGADATDDATAAFLAVVGVMDTMCGSWHADCHSIVLNASVRRIGADIPQHIDSVGSSFRLPAVPTPLVDRWSITVRDLGTDFRSSPKELRVWLFFIIGRSDSLNRGYTVAALEPNGAERLAVVVVHRGTAGWTIRSIAWAAT